VDDRDGVELVSDGLIGRREELGRIRAFLDVVVKDSGARLVWGEPGVGKSVLLAAAAQAADAAGMNVLRASGVEFEADVSYSGLNHALHPVNAALNALSPVHRDALTVALGLGTGAPPDRLVVCNATLALLRWWRMIDRCSWSSMTCTGSTERAPWSWASSLGVSLVPTSAWWRAPGRVSRPSSNAAG